MEQEDCDKLLTGIAKDDKEQSIKIRKKRENTSTVLEYVCMFFAGLAFIINFGDKNWIACTWIVISFIWILSAQFHRKMSNEAFNLMDEMFSIHKRMENLYEEKIELQDKFIKEIQKMFKEAKPNDAGTHDIA